MPVIRKMYARAGRAYDIEHMLIVWTVSSSTAVITRVAASISFHRSIT